MVKTTRRFAAVMLLAVATAALAAEEGPRLLTAPLDRLDVESLQRGARDFVNYCLNCHSAQYMRYNRLSDLGLTEKQIQDNLMFASDKIGSTMTVAMSRADAAAWFGTAPPDLTVESRVRGKDWLYSYLLAFYRDDKTATGWNNLVFPSVAMPHVLRTCPERRGLSRPNMKTATRRRLLPLRPQALRRSNPHRAANTS